MDAFDTVIIGGGHNGLVAAGYLSRAGQKVIVLEKNYKVGGLAITDEIFPGFRYDTFGHHFGFFQPKIIDDLELMRYGLKVNPMPVSIRPFYNGKYAFESMTDPEKSQEQIAKISAHDGEAYADWMLMWLKCASIFKDYLLTPPPSFSEIATKIKGTDEEYSFYRILTTSQKEMLDENFETEEVKAMLAHVMEGPPSSPMMNIYIAFLIAATADVQIRGLDGYLQGGMGALTQALGQSASDSGAAIRTQTEVDRILINDGKVNGVLLKNGTKIASTNVISNLDMKKTFLEMVGTDHLDKGFVDKVNNLHSRAGYLRLHCAVDRLPKWRVLPSFEGPGHVMPSLEFLEKAWDEASYGKVPKEPLVTFRAPCLYDKTLAPEGKFAIEGWVQYVPAHPNKGTWESISDEVGNQIIDYMEDWIIDFRKSILKWKLYTPADIGKWANVTDGHQCHLDLTNDQMFSFRPFIGCTDYRAPIKGLYLCSAATHGGGAVSGIPGHNSAHALIQDLRSGGRVNLEDVTS